MTLITTKKKTNADKDPLLDGYLSAFGILRSDPYEMPGLIKAKFEDTWDTWVLQYGETSSDPVFLLIRAMAFIEYLARKGNTSVYLYPPRVKSGLGNRLTPKQVYDTLILYSLERSALDIAVMLRKTDLLAYLKVVSTKSATTKTHIVTNMCLERSKTADSLDRILPRLRDVLKNNTVPVQLQAVMQKILPARAKTTKPKEITPKPAALLAQFGQSTFGWLPVVKTNGYAAWLIRAHGDRLVLKLSVPLNPQLLAKVPKAIVLRLWVQAFRKIK